MNSLNRWNWLRDLEAFQQSRDNLLSRSPTCKSERQENLTVLAEWSPAIEIREDDKEYVLKAKLAEVKKEDVNVTAAKGTLTIVAHCKFEPEEKDRTRQCVEPTCGSFARTFSLPDDVNPGNVIAEFKDGLLVVHLIKGQQAGPQQVEVKVC